MKQKYELSCIDRIGESVNSVVYTYNDLTLVKNKAAFQRPTPQQMTSTQRQL